MNDEQAGLSLLDGLDLSGMTLPQLWLRYISIGGSENMADIDQQLRGATVISSHQHNLLAQAINEHFIERDENHPVAYEQSHSHR